MFLKNILELKLVLIKSELWAWYINDRYWVSFVEADGFDISMYNAEQYIAIPAQIPGCQWVNQVS